MSTAVTAVMNMTTVRTTITGTENHASCGSS